MAESIKQFIAKLHLDGLAAATILSYISALKFHCKRYNIKHELESDQVKAVLKGTRNLSAESSSTGREACSLKQLKHLIRMATVLYPNYEARLIASMLSLAFFGFLRVSEYTCTPAGHAISVGNMKVQRESLRVTIPSSKTNRSKATIVVREYSRCKTICPLYAFKNYIALRPSHASPTALFVKSDSTPVSSSDASKYLTDLCKACKLSNISSHSLRIGGATWAASEGWSDASIRAHGRWQSNAFVKYVRPS